MRAVIVDPALSGRLAIREVPEPEPGSGEAVVRVRATSLNYGEVRRAMTVAPAGARPGWDFAGEVVQPARDGFGPVAGARVVGFIDGAAWSELLAVPARSLATLPDNVTFAQAATLPVAGLTALLALSKRGLIVGLNVLVNGAAGGVGHFACQLAREAGANVVGVVRREASVAQVREDGATLVVVSDRLGSARELGPFDAILESVGGTSLADALGMLASEGVCVTFGESTGTLTSFDPRPFFRAGEARLYGLLLHEEVLRHPPAAELNRLLRLVSRGRLVPRISHERDWADMAAVVSRFWAGELRGKVVVHFPA